MTSENGDKCVLAFLGRKSRMARREGFALGKILKARNELLKMLLLFPQIRRLVFGTSR